MRKQAVEGINNGSLFPQQPVSVAVVLAHERDTYRIDCTPGYAAASNMIVARFEVKVKPKFL